MITIVLADDHKVVRQGLRALLDEKDDFKVVGEAGSGKEALRLVEILNPNVLVSDMVMADLNGVELTRRVKQCRPATAVVVLSMYGTEGYVHKAMQAGAKAYILKDASAGELIKGIRRAAAGHRYLSRRLSEHAIDVFIENMLPEINDMQITLILTAREREILNRIAQGDNNGKIASGLFISRRTVEFHRANIMRKLGLHSQQELFRYCARTGLIKE